MFSVIITWRKYDYRFCSTHLEAWIAWWLYERFTDWQHDARPHLTIIVVIVIIDVAISNGTTSPRWRHSDVTVHVEGHVTATDAQRHLVTTIVNSRHEMSRGKLLHGRHFVTEMQTTEWVKKVSCWF